MSVGVEIFDNSGNVMLDPSTTGMSFLMGSFNSNKENSGSKWIGIPEGCTGLFAYISKYNSGEYQFFFPDVWTDGGYIKWQYPSKSNLDQTAVDGPDVRITYGAYS